MVCGILSILNCCLGNDNLAWVVTRDLANDGGVVYSTGMKGREYGIGLNGIDGSEKAARGLGIAEEELIILSAITRVKN